MSKKSCLKGLREELLSNVDLSVALGSAFEVANPPSSGLYSGWRHTNQK